MIGLAILCWATLAVFVAVFLRVWLRPDAGFGAAWKGKDWRHEAHGPPVASEPTGASPGSLHH